MTSIMTSFPNSTRPTRQTWKHRPPAIPPSATPRAKNPIAVVWITVFTVRYLPTRTVSSPGANLHSCIDLVQGDGAVSVATALLIKRQAWVVHNLGATRCDDVHLIRPRGSQPPRSSRTLTDRRQEAGGSKPESLRPIGGARSYRIQGAEDCD